MMMGGGLLVGLIVLVLFLVLVGGGIAAVVWFVSQESRGPSQRLRYDEAGKDQALETLRQRYAAGEIDREEFERMREEIRS